MRSVRQLLLRPLVKNGTKSVSFKTIDKSGTKQVAFKTIDKSGTNRVSFWAMEETNNKSIPFKTFDERVKASTAKCDMVLKDALSFISGKRSALYGEKDSPQTRPAPPARSNPATQSQAASGQAAPVTPSHPGRLHRQRRDPYGAHENIPHAAKAEVKSPFKTIRHGRQSRSRSRSRSRTGSNHQRNTQ